MAIPFKKYGYTINPITDEIETPQIFLVNKRLKKIGELYPVENLRITVNEINQPDEVSFTYYKEINGEKSPYFNDIDDLSVIQVGGFGFFECSIGKNHNSSVLKTVTAKSLGCAELSQTLHTLEVNTEDDMSRSDYDKDYPTIFYREIPTDADEETAKKLRESSLLHRILTETPHYKIGYVDPTLWYVQRTFSWSDKDIVSILNEVAEEITCIFDIQVRIGDNGEIERIVNAYDMQYCSHCWEEVKEYGETVTSSTSKFRNIVNGVCQNCGESKYVKDIGEDSGIYISTDNLSDDISINGDPDSIKNCFKITGGDDIMTATVQGLNMSASSKIMAFSDLQKKAMSPELRKKLNDYNSDYSDNIEDYEALLETEYNMQDIRLYLQSGKMPQIEKEIKTTDEALYSVLSNIVKHFNKKFYISSYKNYYKYPTSSARTSISNMFTTFMPEGFSMTIDKSSSEEDTPGKDFDSNAIYGWYGTIKVYSTGNRDDSYTLHITKSNGTYVTSGTSEEHYISSDTSIQSMVDNFRIQFYFADQTQEEYKEYLEQYTAYLLSTVDLSYENEQKKEWDKYGYNLLKSYADGYQKCIETIDDMLSTAKGETHEILNETRATYVSIQNDILLQMNVLEDQIFAVCRYLGGSYDDSYLNDNGEISYNYKYYKDDKKATIQEIFDHMINPDYVGGYNDDQTVYTPNEYIGDKPFKCLKCNSSNVVISTEGNVCRNNGCGAKGSDIYTYRDMMKNIADSYREHSNSGKTIVELRTDYRNRFDVKNYLGDTLYIELRSFIREDVYNNSNFTSDGLSNSQIIEQAKELKAKAEQELAKACNPQYSVTTSLSSVVAQKEFVYQGVKVNDDYSKFKINNYVRVLIDEDLFKMRLTSITFQFPVTDKIEVTFSNVTNCKTNTAMNVKEILDSAASMATSYDYVATQADKGAVANDQFVDIMNEGLNASLMAVKNSRDQDVVIDNHGILLRKKIHETDEYSPYQMKLINRNIVMTDDNWETAKLAIGLGLYEGVERYGVWADVICGNLLCGNKLAIYGGGDGTAENATVIIDGKGITLDGGKITWTKKLPTSSVDGLDDTLEYQLEQAQKGINDAATAIGLANTAQSCANSAYSRAENAESNAKKYADSQDTVLSTNLTTAYQKYAESKVKELDDSVSKYLGLGGTTLVTDKYMISPYLGGGYLNIASEDGNARVIIDPKNLGNTGYIFQVQSDGAITTGITPDGKGYFSGEIQATSGSIGGWEINEKALKSEDGTNSLILNSDGTISSIGYFGNTSEGFRKSSLILSGGTLIGQTLNDDDTKDYEIFNFNPREISFFDDEYKFSRIDGASFYRQFNLRGSRTEIDSYSYVYKKMYFGDGGYIELQNNNYIRTYKSDQTTSVALIGWSSGNNIWIAHWANDDNYKPDSIVLNAKNVVYTGNAPSATSSDIRIKSDISYIDNAKDFILNLEPKKYKVADSTSDRRHMGFIAQDVECLMLNTIGDTGLVVKQTFNEDIPIDFNDDSTYTYALRYEEFIAPIVATIQYQQKEIECLKEELETLKSICNHIDK